MRRYTFSLMMTLGLVLLCSTIVFASTVPKDIVLMIDNSGSMKENDPNFLTKNAVTEFVSKLSEDTRFAVLFFDQEVNLALPLTTVSEAAQEDILASFENLDFQGKFTDIPAAIERAIYELKTKGREESQKSIVFITDGIIDTGDKGRDADRARWLRENLCEEAADHRIKIFGIAFTDLADFELIQFLAQRTNGEYFRAFTPEDIIDVFSQINELIVRIEPVIEHRTISVEAPGPTEPPMPTPAPVQPTVQSKRLSLPVIIVGILIASAVIVLVIFFWTRRKKVGMAAGRPGRYVGDAAEPLPEAELHDMSGVTGQDVFEIKDKLTKIGRLSGTQEDQINSIVIDRKTISRKHAVIEYKNHSFWITDLGSSNGTFLNGRRVAKEVQLKHDDTISFDTYDFKFIMREIARADLEAVDKTVFRPKEDPTKVSPRQKAETEKEEKPKPAQREEKSEKVKTPVQESPTAKDKKPKPTGTA